MDELAMVGELLAEDPPEGAADAGRARLRREMHAAAPRRRLARRWRSPAVMAMAAAATASVVTGTVLLVPSVGPRAPDAASRPSGGGDVLLTAAENAVRATGSGRFWHVKVKEVVPVRVGPKDDPYWVQAGRVRETWTARDQTSWLGVRDLAVRPVGPDDAAAWRRDGRPRDWTWGDPGSAQLRRLDTARPRPATVAVAEAARRPFMVCDKELKFAEVGRLPAGPAALSGRLAELVARSGGAPEKRAVARAGERTSSQRDKVTRCLAEVVMDVPAAPPVRAAAYRALADRPGVGTSGTATDERGRVGQVVTIRPTRADGAAYRLLIDPATSLVLTDEQVRTATRPQGTRRVYLEIGWTDAPPEAPEVP